MTKKKTNEFIFYTENGDIVNVSVYRDVIKTNTFEGNSERLGIPDFRDENGDPIKVIGEGDDMEFETFFGEKLYLKPPKKDV